MLEVGIDTYATVAQADEYIAKNYLSTDERRAAWDALAEEDKEVCLRRATMRIESQPWPGEPVCRNQKLAFPRKRNHCTCRNWGCFNICSNILLDVPEDIINAEIEEAFEIGAPGKDTDDYNETGGGKRGAIKSKRLDAYTIQYADSANAKGNKELLADSGIVSGTAKDLLKSYMGGGYSIYGC